MTLVLGIDPGSRITGYGLVSVRANQFDYVDSGCVKAGEGPFYQRLLHIFDEISRVMREYNPAQVAVEQVFISKNVNAALKLGQARGAAVVAAAQNGASIHDYAAREIKQAIVGYGNAEKEQVQHMITRLLNLNKRPQSDEADALAVAICHAQMHKVKRLLAEQRG